MDVLYRAGRATAAEVQEGMAEAPSYSAVRTMLRILEDKGHVKHEQDGPRYVYIPTVARDKAKKSALKHVVNTFFDGSASQVMAALIERDMDDGELARIRELIDNAKKVPKERRQGVPVDKES
jgi:predicted transcriptional regulator